MLLLFSRVLTLSLWLTWTTCDSLASAGLPPDQQYGTGARTSNNAPVSRKRASGYIDRSQLRSAQKKSGSSSSSSSGGITGSKSDDIGDVMVKKIETTVFTERESSRVNQSHSTLTEQDMSEDEEDGGLPAQPRKKNSTKVTGKTYPIHSISPTILQHQNAVVDEEDATAAHDRIHPIPLAIPLDQNAFDEEGDLSKPSELPRENATKVLVETNPTSSVISLDQNAINDDKDLTKPYELRKKPTGFPAGETKEKFGEFFRGILDPEGEKKDEEQDFEIFEAVITSLAEWQLHKIEKQLMKGNRVRRSEEQVCYKDLGCFRDEGIFDYLDMLPSPPEEVNTRFLLYSRESPDREQVLRYQNVSSITSSSYNNSKPTKIIIHGFGSSCHRVWVHEMRITLLHREDANVICVDWEKGASVPNYVRAASNTRLVGTQLAVLVETLNAIYNTTNENFHLIGFSLGAHVSGHAGARLTNLSRITGLDPAGPLFESYGSRVRLDATDANFVDVIHTNADSILMGGLGAFQPMGHVDFYPNGGRMQKGCTNLFVGGFSDILWPRKGDGRYLCNHRRSYKFFMDSVVPHCKFPSFVCRDYDTFLKGECFPCSRCGNMGYYADKAEGRGQLYLVTRETEPFCANQYKVSVSHSASPGIDPVTTYGRIDLTFVAQDGINETLSLTKSEDEALDSGSRTVRILVPHPALERVHGVQLRYTAYKGWIYNGFNRWAVDKISLIDSFGQTLSFCNRGTTLLSGKTVLFPLVPGDCTVIHETPELGQGQGQGQGQGRPWVGEPTTEEAENEIHPVAQLAVVPTDQSNLTLNTTTTSSAIILVNISQPLAPPIPTPLVTPLGTPIATRLPIPLGNPFPPAEPPTTAVASVRATDGRETLMEFGFMPPLVLAPLPYHPHDQGSPDMFPRQEAGASPTRFQQEFGGPPDEMHQLLQEHQRLTGPLKLQQDGHIRTREKTAAHDGYVRVESVIQGARPERPYQVSPFYQDTYLTEESQHRFSTAPFLSSTTPREDVALSSEEPVNVIPAPNLAIESQPAAPNERLPPGDNIQASGQSVNHTTPITRIKSSRQESSTSTSTQILLQQMPVGVLHAMGPTTPSLETQEAFLTPQSPRKTLETSSATSDTTHESFSSDPFSRVSYLQRPLTTTESLQHRKTHTFLSVNQEVERPSEASPLIPTITSSSPSFEATKPFLSSGDGDENLTEPEDGVSETLPSFDNIGENSREHEPREGAGEYTTGKIDETHDKDRIVYMQSIDGNIREDEQEEATQLDSPFPKPENKKIMKVVKSGNKNNHELPTAGTGTRLPTIGTGLETTPPGDSSSILHHGYYVVNKPSRGQLGLPPIIMAKEDLRGSRPPPEFERPYDREPGFDVKHGDVTLNEDLPGDRDEVSRFPGGEHFEQNQRFDHSSPSDRHDLLQEGDPPRFDFFPEEDQPRFDLLEQDSPPFKSHATLLYEITSPDERSSLLTSNSLNGETPERERARSLDLGSPIIQLTPLQGLNKVPVEGEERGGKSNYTNLSDPSQIADASHLPLPSLSAGGDDVGMRPPTLQQPNEVLQQPGEGPRTSTYAVVPPAAETIVGRGRAPQPYVLLGPRPPPPFHSHLGSNGHNVHSFPPDEDATHHQNQTSTGDLSDRPSPSLRQGSRRGAKAHWVNNIRILAGDDGHTSDSSGPLIPRPRVLQSPGSSSTSSYYIQILPPNFSALTHLETFSFPSRHLALPPGGLKSPPPPPSPPVAGPAASSTPIVVRDGVPLRKNFRQVAAIRRSRAGRGRIIGGGLPPPAGRAAFTPLVLQVQGGGRHARYIPLRPYSHELPPPVLSRP